MLWFGSWLTGSNGEESSWFYSGRGNETGRYPVPEDASGFRVRQWPSEGIDAEYVDVPFDGVNEYWASQLNFDVKQPNSRLPERYDHETRVQA